MPTIATIVVASAIFVINIVALGLVPARRRSSSSSMAWLLLIFFLPRIGLDAAGEPFDGAKTYRHTYCVDSASDILARAREGTRHPQR